MKPDRVQVRSNEVGRAASGDELAWIDRARSGDEEAFRLLVDRHRDRAFALALRILRTRGDAEEAAQDAFVRVWRALPRFRGEAAFSTWLYRIVARRAFDLAAARKRRERHERTVEEPPDVAGEAGGDDERIERFRRLERLMGELSEVQRAVVTLYYHQDRSVEDVGGILGLPENTVKTHLARARGVLRAAWLREEQT